MKTIIYKLIDVSCIIMAVSLSGLWAKASENGRMITNRTVIGYKGRITISNIKEIKPVGHKELLDILGDVEKGNNTEEMNNKLSQFPKVQKLETAAYCLKENKYISQIIQRMSIDTSLWDRCLVPYLAEVMPKLKDHDLMIAAKVASKIPDINLMEPLLNYAVESEYQESFEGGSGRFSEIVHMSAFQEAALAISTITNGKIGTTDKIMSKDARLGLIQEWRAAWPGLKYEMQKEIHPVAHKELLELLARAEEAGLSYRDEFVKQFKTFKWIDKLETIAYSLEHELYPNAISCYMLYSEKDMQDKRLMPFINKAIEESKGVNLYAAVRIAAVNPDPSLLPSLIKYGFDTDYVKISKYGDGKYDVEYSSVFGWASEAVYKITNGKIGDLQYFYTFEEIPEEEKKSQIEKWRKIYDETLKKDYEKN